MDTSDYAMREEKKRYIAFPTLFRVLFIAQLLQFGHHLAHGRARIK